MNVLDRMKAPTPKFFRVLRTIGLSLLAASGAIVVAPVAVPAALLTAAGYLTVAGGVLTAVSQAAVEDKRPEDDDDAGQDYYSEVVDD